MWGTEGVDRNYLQLRDDAKRSVGNSDVLRLILLPLQGELEPIGKGLDFHTIS